MPFIDPMLAQPLKPEKFTLEPGKWAVEEKYDGHRIITEIGDGASNLFATKPITAWSRYGLERTLPSHLLEALGSLSDGIFDGELLVPGKRSYGVTELTNSSDLVYFIFDVVSIHDVDTTPLNYDDRREVLRKCVENLNSSAVKLAPSFNVDTINQINQIRDGIWARDGEGLILKRRAAPYQIGKRSKDFLKIKAKRSAVLTVIGFVPSHGLIMNRGNYATIVIQNPEGDITTVKTRNDTECRKLEVEGPETLEWREIRVLGKPIRMIVNHPAVGRKLAIEYQERTPDGNYRHPRFDHWE